MNFQKSLVTNYLVKVQSQDRIYFLAPPADDQIHILELQANSHVHCQNQKYPIVHTCIFQILHYFYIHL
uniref:Ovule protein n=1 Tax=Strongyloides papillosus TaxID=174720 RepID=A0A0N5CCN1_STREA